MKTRLGYCIAACYLGYLVASFGTDTGILIGRYYYRDLYTSLPFVFFALSDVVDGVIPAAALALALCLLIRFGKRGLRGKAGRWALVIGAMVFILPGLCASYGLLDHLGRGALRFWGSDLLFWGSYVLLPAAVAVFLTRRRPAPGVCLKCGYDLPTSKDRCPKCGTPIATSPCPTPAP